QAPSLGRPRHRRLAYRALSSRWQRRRSILYDSYIQPPEARKSSLFALCLLSQMKKEQGVMRSLLCMALAQRNVVYIDTALRIPAMHIDCDAGLRGSGGEGDTELCIGGADGPG